MNRSFSVAALAALLPMFVMSGPDSVASSLWYPGHYLRGYVADYNTTPVLTQGKFTGFEAVIPWRHIEPVKDQYNFALIDKMLAELRPKGKKLVLDIQYKTYNKEATAGQCAPAGVEAVQFVRADRTPMCLSLMWKPAVADQFRKLLRKIGERYLSAADISAIVFEETATSLTTTQQNQLGFTEAAYLNELKNVWVVARVSMPGRAILPQLNFTPGGTTEMRKLFDFLCSVGVGVNGPDMAPGWHTHASPLYREYAGKMPLAMENQYTVLKRFVDDGATPQDLYDWAVDAADGLRANFIFWNRGTDQWPGPGWDFTRDLIPMLERNSWRINAGLPANQTVGVFPTPCN